VRSTLLLVVVWPSPVCAHDLEKTQILLVFARDGSFVVDVANDPSWLKLRLASFGGGPDTTALQRTQSFADRVVLWVDGREVRPTAVEVIPGPTLTTHRLRGRMPVDAHTLRWYYGLVVDPYPLTVRRADGRVVIEEVAGDAWSRTIDVSGQFQAPLLSGRLAGWLVAALLLVPLVIRFATKTRKHETSNRLVS
jgi:hypothetical protein